MAKVEGWHHKDVHHLCCQPLRNEGVRNSVGSGCSIVLGLLFLLLLLSFKAVSIVVSVLNRIGSLGPGFSSYLHPPAPQNENWGAEGLPFLP